MNAHTKTEVQFSLDTPAFLCWFYENNGFEEFGTIENGFDIWMFDECPDYQPEAYVMDDFDKAYDAQCQAADDYCSDRGL